MRERIDIKVRGNDRHQAAGSRKCASAEGVSVLAQVGTGISCGFIMRYKKMRQPCSQPKAGLCLEHQAPLVVHSY